MASANHIAHVDKLTMSMARDTGEPLQHGAFNHARIVRSVVISLLHYVCDVKGDISDLVEANISVSVE